MTPQELEEQSKRAVIDYLQDSSVRLESICKTCIAQNKWYPDTNNFNIVERYYRIAKPKPWYRVAKCKDIPTGKIFTITADPDFGMKESDVEQRPDFIEWLTDRVEY